MATNDREIESKTLPRRSTTELIMEAGKLYTALSYLKHKRVTFTR